MTIQPHLGRQFSTLPLYYTNYLNPTTISTSSIISTHQRPQLHQLLQPNTKFKLTNHLNPNPSPKMGGHAFPHLPTPPLPPSTYHALRIQTTNVRFPPSLSLQPFSNILTPLSSSAHSSPTSASPPKCPVNPLMATSTSWPRGTYRFLPVRHFPTTPCWRV